MRRARRHGQRRGARDRHRGTSATPWPCTPQFGHSVAARALLVVGAFAPGYPAFVRCAGRGSSAGRIINLVITNSLGNQTLATGVTSYHGGVYSGLNGDRKAVSDVDILAGMIEGSLEELEGAQNW